MAGAKLPGFRRGGLFNRGYLTPSGASISYRQYRNLLEQEALVRKLEPAAYAELRRKQIDYQSIVNQMAKVRGEAIDRAIENATAGGAPPKRIAELKRQRRAVKSAAIKSPTRK